MWHKKWMFICLLLGSILLIATAASYPMYRNAVSNRMLQDEFGQSLEDNGEWPAMIDMVIMSKKNENGTAMSGMEKITAELPKTLGLTEKNAILFYALTSADAHSMMNREDSDDRSIRLAYMSNIDEHITFLDGDIYSETGVDENGYIEVIINESAMLSLDVVVGECYEFNGLKDVEGNILRIKIAGIFKEDNNSDFYWQNSGEALQMMFFMNDSLFRTMFTGANAGKYSITCHYNVLFQYDDVQASDVADLVSKTNYLTEESNYKSVVSTPDYMNVLSVYTNKESRINTTLFILQIPVMLLLCAFLFMISCQMYELEQNDISVLKSRGASRGQIFRLYLYQNMVLSILGMLVGLPLGSLFCRILGSANNFLEFKIKRSLTVSYNTDVFLYAGVAVLVSILIMTVPALKHSKLSIVNLKQKKALKKRSWWEKCFLDVIFLGVSIYGFYSYSRNTDSLLQNALKGEALDPLLYISSSLFILGAGMLLLRLQPLLVGLIYLIRRKKWHPASYASFMETMKNGRKQQYIMLFMILTVSLGMFNAVSARTILQNTLDNTEYLDGADIIMQETWKDNSAFVGSDPSIEFQYYEPDYARFTGLKGAQCYTKVLDETKAYVTISGTERQSVEVMGIHTKEFGTITSVADEILAKPYYQYLNDLAVNAEGVLVSADFRSVLGYKEGDLLVFYNASGERARGVIVGFFDYWPSYEPTTVTLDEGNNVNKTANYLIVGHLSTLQQYWGTTPYQVWISVKDNENTDFFYQWIANNNITLSSYTDRDKDVETVTEDPLLQGMNGVLTMSFIVMIILCAVGYLIYWIMSIRSREMMFGVLRAFGMHKEEILQMLINEQIFSGIYSIFAGILIGTIAYKMFVPMLQMAYSTTAQVLPLVLITETSDMVRLYLVVSATMVLCIVILTLLVNKLNITKALKLGEE